MTSTAIPTSEVADVFDAYEPPIRDRLLALRSLILDTADATDGVGPIEETLKWGQPSYLTTETGSGSTVRVAPAGARSPHDFGLYFICQTTLVDDFRSLFGDRFTYDGNRALLFDVDDELPVEELRTCITMALTYHLRR